MPTYVPMNGGLMPCKGRPGVYKLECVNIRDEDPPEPTCLTNQILKDGECQCPDGLVKNPNTDRKSDPIVNTHYIFVLDRSGSMTMNGNDYWTPLIEGFTAFLDVAAIDDVNFESTKVSAIGYDDQSE